MVELLKKEIAGVGWFGWLFIALGVATQVMAYSLSPEVGAVSLISGIAGIFSVVLCSQRRYVFYAFAWVQLATYMYLSWDQRLWGEVLENLFYAGTMLAGMVTWAKHYDDNSAAVVSAKLSRAELAMVCAMTAGLTGVFGYILNFTDDSQPWLDSASTVPAFVAQCLLMSRCRENWIFWLVIDVASIIMWLHAGNICMAAQFVFWTLNCVYGFAMWSRGELKNSEA